MEWKESSFHKFFQREYDPVLRRERVIDKFCASKRSILSLKETKTLQGHKSCVNTISFSPCGDLLISGSDDTTVKLWDLNTEECLLTLKGHRSNVFSGLIFPHKCNKEYISGGNDADIRYWEVANSSTGCCTVLQHHTMKVLGMSINPVIPDTFLSCSADGTVRYFDCRKYYQNSYTHTLGDDIKHEPVIPQAFGGGRKAFSSDFNTQSILLNFQKLREHALYSIEFHPYDGRSFIVSSEDGNVRLYDLRYIDRTNPLNCVNTYRNIKLTNYEFASTGCSFSKDGNEVLSTNIRNYIYTFDTYHKFSDLKYVPEERQKKRHRGVDTDHPIDLEKRNRHSINNNNNNNSIDDNEIELDDDDKERRKKKRIINNNNNNNDDEELKDDIEMEEVKNNNNKDDEEEDDDEEDEIAINNTEEPQINNISDAIEYISNILPSDDDDDDDDDQQNNNINTAEENNNNNEIIEDESDDSYDIEDDSDDDDDNNSGVSDSNSDDNEENGELSVNSSDIQIYYPTVMRAIHVYKNHLLRDKIDTAKVDVNAEFQGNSYKNIYRGHLSKATVKGVNFFGPNSEYILSGSDDGHIYIWDRESCKIVNILRGHKKIVNCVEPHPSAPILASCGLERVIKIWEPCVDLSDAEEVKINEGANALTEKNCKLVEAKEKDGCSLQ